MKLKTVAFTTILTIALTGCTDETYVLDIATFKDIPKEKKDTFAVSKDKSDPFASVGCAFGSMMFLEEVLKGQQDAQKKGDKFDLFKFG